MIWRLRYPYTPIVRKILLLEQDKDPASLTEMKPSIADLSSWNSTSRDSLMEIYIQADEQLYAGVDSEFVSNLSRALNTNISVDEVRLD